MTLTIELYNDQGDKASFTQTLTVAVPPVFSATLDSTVELTVGTAKQWEIPVADFSPLQASPVDSLVVTIPASLQNYISFDGAQKFSFTDDQTVRNSLAAGMSIQI